MLHLSIADAQHCFPFISLCRAVRGPLDHGDAQRAQQQWLGRYRCHLHHLRSVCSADSGHPAGHGGAFGLPTCLASALVRAMVLWSSSQISLWEGTGGHSVRHAVPVLWIISCLRQMKRGRLFQRELRDPCPELLPGATCLSSCTRGGCQHVRQMAARSSVLVNVQSHWGLSDLRDKAQRQHRHTAGCVSHPRI